MIIKIIFFGIVGAVAAAHLEPNNDKPPSKRWMVVGALIGMGVGYLYSLSGGSITECSGLGISRYC